jgi:hypothetical protein
MGALPPREQGYKNNMNSPYPNNGPPPGPNQQGQQGQPDRRRRTKATISELSVEVQVAVMVSDCTNCVLAPKRCVRF